MRKFIVETEIFQHFEVLDFVSKNLVTKISDSANLICDAINLGQKIIIFGNGGSAGDAQHFAAELVGRFRINRKGLPALALTTDTSALTAIGNDFGFELIFKRQLESLAKSNDIVMGISTSGSSLNVIKAFEYANSINCKTISLTGNNGGDLSKISDININVNSANTARIQEMHILILHIFCAVIDDMFI